MSNPIPELLAQLGSMKTFELEYDRYLGAPIFPAHWPGFVYALHRRHEVVSGQPRTSASGTITMQEHSGTHIDALCHQAVNMEMYGGIRVTPDVQTARGFTRLGAETIPPILKRGILLDVAAAQGVERLPAGYMVDGDDLKNAAKAQKVTPKPDDCILVRTGNGREFANSETYLAGAGIGGDAARWLASHNPFLCGADNVAFDLPDNIDPELGSLPSHTILIVSSGIHIVENLNLEELAAAQCREFLFVCLPMKLRGVTGSPVRPIAMTFQN